MRSRGNNRKQRSNVIWLVKVWRLVSRLCRACIEFRNVTRLSLFTDIFIPHFGVGRNVTRQQLYALFRIEIDHLDAVLSKPINGALKIDRLADDHCSDSELANQTAAVPARRKRRHHYLLAIASLPAGFAKGVSFAVHRQIVLLNAPVVSSPEQFALLIEQRRANRDAAFSESPASFFDRDSQH
jgi:hypothetical protein